MNNKNIFKYLLIVLPSLSKFYISTCYTKAGISTIVGNKTNEKVSIDIFKIFLAIYNACICKTQLQGNPKKVEKTNSKFVSLD